jgi:hypothetical protein
MIQGRAMQQHHGLPTGGATSPVPDGRVGPDEVVRVQGDHLFLSGSCRGELPASPLPDAVGGVADDDVQAAVPVRPIRLTDRWVSLVAADNHGDLVPPVTHAGVNAERCLGEAV